MECRLQGAGASSAQANAVRQHDHRRAPGGAGIDRQAGREHCATCMMPSTSVMSGRMTMTTSVAAALSPPCNPRHRLGRLAAVAGCCAPRGARIVWLEDSMPKLERHFFVCQTSARPWLPSRLRGSAELLNALNEAPAKHPGLGQGRRDRWWLPRPVLDWSQHRRLPEASGTRASSSISPGSDRRAHGGRKTGRQPVYMA